MKLIGLLPLLSLLLFLAAFIVYKVYTRREWKELKYSKPKRYEREPESEYQNLIDEHTKI